MHAGNTNNVNPFLHIALYTPEGLLKVPQHHYPWSLGFLVHSLNHLSFLGSVTCATNFNNNSNIIKSYIARVSTKQGIQGAEYYLQTFRKIGYCSDEF